MGISDVAIPPHLIEAVAGHLTTHVGPDQDALLFGAKGGRHPAACRFDRWYCPARQAANRPDLRFDDLRHFGAVLAAATSASLAELMGRLGHSTPSGPPVSARRPGPDREIATLLSKLTDSR